MDVISRKEAKASGLDKYFTGKPCARGHLCERRTLGAQCIECQRLLAKKHYEENTDVYKLRASAWGQANPERLQEIKQNWLDKNRDKFKIVVRRWRSRNPEKVRDASKTWAANNRGVKRARDARRRANKLQAQPLWVNKESIRKIYWNCPPGYHVDHQIPLKHPLVCGLHVPWNLEAIPANENLCKNNKFDPETYVHVFPPTEDYELPLAA